MPVYTTQGTCARKISFEIEDGKIHNVDFLGGCNGNLKGIAALVEGKPVEEVIQTLKGITCGPKPTSCPDQLATALQLYMSNQK
ncbi:MAG TPA: TIGR03905 family TSCPD domain-containing protein [Eggerthellaceae bacterium]|nr:TIGR03905 family TSCPD domain-containing protein [Eggerthellaceae bacterium]